MNIQARLAKYAPLRLKADLNGLNDSERRILPLLIKAAQAMDEPFWIQNYGERETLLASVTDPDTRRCIQLNYGPWDRLLDNEPFLVDAGVKPRGANFYPPDMTRAEFEAAAAVQPELKSPYTMVRRDDQGNLVAVPYRRFFQEYVQRAAEKLKQAAELAEEPGLKAYLALRAEALLIDDYRPSDLVWAGMKETAIEILIGPMEVEDQFLGIKTAYAASMLLKNAMQARFEKNLAPLADLIIAEEQRPSITFEAYFNYVMLHELAHGLGIRQTIAHKELVKEELVKEALGEQYHVIEEGKADVMGLVMMDQLHQWEVVSKDDLHDFYVTSLVKHIWNGDSRQSIMWLNYFKERGACSRDDGTGTYRIHMEQIPAAARSLAERFLRFQGDGDYQGASAFLEQYGRPDKNLKRDIERIDAADLPIGLAVEQDYDWWSDDQDAHS